MTPGALPVPWVHGGAPGVQGIGGPATVRSSNGGVGLRLDPAVVGPVDVETSNGTLRFHIDG